MSVSVLYMSMLLDGFITGPNEGPRNVLLQGDEVVEQGRGDRSQRLWEHDDPHARPVRETKRSTACATV